MSAINLDISILRFSFYFFFLTAEYQMDLYDWADENPPPGTMMVIDGHEQLGWLAGTLSELEDKGFRILKQWDWAALFSDEQETTTTSLVVNSSVKSPWFCEVCFVAAPSLEDFTTHLKSVKHAYGVSISPSLSLCLFQYNTFCHLSYIYICLSVCRSGTGMLVKTMWIVLTLLTCPLVDQMYVFKSSILILKLMISTALSYADFSLQELDLLLNQDMVRRQMLTSGRGRRRGPLGPLRPRHTFNLTHSKAS